ncbi:MAG: DUF1295 domain-containing protein [Pseudomonadota bacterium]
MTAFDLFFLILSNLVVLLFLMTGLWFISIRIKDASIVDIFWGPACALPAVLTFFRFDGADPRAAVLTLLVCLWAARLGIYLAQRNLGHGEDYRYQRMRAAQKSDAAMARWSLPNVFWLQGLVAWFVSLPVQLGQFGGGGFGVVAIFGVALFLVGLAFEAVGDWQLRRFKANPANEGKLMTSGLWAWTRHPNYFGDAMAWTGLTVIALESPYGFWALASPAVMAFFLVRVSGKSLTEKHMVKKYPEYAAYKKRVSGFFPLPPKN